MSGEKQHTFFVAGVKFHDLSKVIMEIEEGDSVELTPEPANQFDPNAVKIIYMSSEGNEVMIGYVPKKISAEISGWLEIGDVEATITKVNKTAAPWEQCEVTVTFVSEDEVEDEEDDDDLSDEDLRAEVDEE